MNTVAPDCVQRTSIADGGGVEKPPPGNRSLLFIQRLKNIPMFKRVQSARTKADSDMLPIAPTSSPTIGNTLVSCIPAYCPPKAARNSKRFPISPAKIIGTLTRISTLFQIDNHPTSH